MKRVKHYHIKHKVVLSLVVIEASDRCKRMLNIVYEVWLKSNGTGRPADMVEDPLTNKTHDINS